MSSPLDDDDELDDIDVDFGDEGATGEVVTGSSGAAKADCISTASLSSLSGSMALYSRASEGFGGGAATIIGRAAIGGEAAATGLPLPPSSSDSPTLRRGDEVKNSRSFERFAPEGPEPLFFLFFFSSAAVAPPVPPAVVAAF